MFRLYLQANNENKTSFQPILSLFIYMYTKAQVCVYHICVYIEIHGNEENSKDLKIRVYFLLLSYFKLLSNLWFQASLALIQLLTLLGPQRVKRRLSPNQNLTSSYHEFSIQKQSRLKSSSLSWFLQSNILHLVSKLPKQTSILELFLNLKV